MTAQALRTATAVRGRRSHCACRARRRPRSLEELRHLHLVVPAVLSLTVAACAEPVDTAGEPLIFDPCAGHAVHAPEASAAQSASVDDALGLWRQVGAASFARADVGEVVVTFRDAAPSIYGYYDEGSATVYVNTDLADPAQRAIVIAHELGHAMGLAHVDPSERPSLMNPGNLTVAPTDADTAALTARWGACAAAPPS